METCAIILAASEDDRIRTADTKVMLAAAGKPVVSWVKKALDQAGIHDQMYIVSYRQEKVREELGESVAFALQEIPLGTGHAVTQAEPFLYERKGATVVMAGDTPLVRAETLSGLIRSFEQGSWGALVLTAEVEDPAGYGRIVRNDAGDLIAIVEELESDAKTKKISEVNSGIYCFDTELLYQAMNRIEEREEQDSGRFPLTDVIDILSRQGVRVGTLSIDPVDFFKIRSRRDLSIASRELNNRVLERIMNDGVTILDPQTTWVDDDVVIGEDTIILPGCRIHNSCVIGKNCTIGPNTNLSFTYIGDHSTLTQSEARQASIDKNCQIGPWANLTDGAEIAENCVIGSNVDINNSRLGADCLIHNQVSLNQAELGEGVTVGSQVSFAYNEGDLDNRIIVGNHCFIGSQSCLIAPVTLENNSYVAAGTVVTRDVPKNALAIGRQTPEIKDNWVLRRR